MDTQTIDTLFLELSQVTKATTAKEIALLKRVRDLQEPTAQPSSSAPHVLTPRTAEHHRQTARSRISRTTTPCRT